MISSAQVKQRQRQPLTIFTAVITALFIKGFRQKFIKSANTRRHLAFVWVVLQPMLHVGLWLGMRELYGLKSTGPLDPVISILIGAYIFLVCLKVINASLSLIKGNKGLYQYRQIKPIDVLISSLLLELFIHFCSAVLVFTLCWWIGIPWTLYDPLRLIVNFASFLLSLFGVALSLAITCFFFRFIQDFSMIFMRILYFTSGVFFSVEMIPERLLTYLAYNPIFQMIVIARECFANTQPHIVVADSSYLFSFGIISTFIGLSLYFGTRRRIMTEINQR